MKTKKILLYLSITVIVLIIFLVIGRKAGWFGQTAMVKVATEKAAYRTIVEATTANGKVQPETEVKISPDVSGEIVELHVQEGDEVQAGDLLLKIKPDSYEAALSRMEASVNTAKANLANAKARLAQVEAQFQQAKRSYERNKKLYDDGAISEAEYETALSNYEVAEADVEAANQNVNSAKFSVASAEASLTEARENLSKTTIYAPMSGTISMLNVEKGERVVGTMQMAGTEMLRIANLNEMEVTVDVNENNIVKISMGDTALIEVDAYLEDEFKGVVTEIANSANTTGVTTDQVTNFEVKIRILPSSYQHLIPENDSTYYPFRPGMSASVDILTEQKNNVLSVPIQAVTMRLPSDTISGERERRNQRRESAENKEDNAETDDTTEPSEEEMEVVFVYDETTQTVGIRPVTTGIQDSHYIEILNGLQENEHVVTAPYSAISKRLEQGMKVQRLEKDKLFETEED